jgi:hypothetical protein
MSDEATPGVLLRGADGNHFFIPHTDLSKYAVKGSPDTGGKLDESTLRVDAFAVQRPAADAEESAAFMPMPENSAAANMPTPEAG